MIFARSITIACLTVMKALCWLTAALLMLLTVVQFARGDADARPVMTLATGATFLALGFASAWGARRFLMRAD